MENPKPILPTNIHTFTASNDADAKWLSAIPIKAGNKLANDMGIMLLAVR